MKSEQVHNIKQILGKALMELNHTVDGNYYRYFEPVYLALEQLEGEIAVSSIKVKEIKKEFIPIKASEMRSNLTDAPYVGSRSHKFTNAKGE